MKLSILDKKLLKRMLGKDGISITAKYTPDLGIPRTTFQRRVKFLKDNYIFTFNILNQKGLNFRRIDLMISSNSGETKSLATELLKRDEVILITSRIGEHNVDLRVEIIITDNMELLELIDEIKTDPRVKDVQWSEIVEILGKKKSVPDSIIDNL